MVKLYTSSFLIRTFKERNTLPLYAFSFFSATYDMERVRVCSNVYFAVF